jgi:hypothetical protein
MHYQRGSGEVAVGRDAKSGWCWRPLSQPSGPSLGDGSLDAPHYLPIKRRLSSREQIPQNLRLLGMKRRAVKGMAISDEPAGTRHIWVVFCPVSE